jgi:hypothetical protein
MFFINDWDTTNSIFFHGILASAFAVASNGVDNHTDPHVLLYVLWQLVARSSYFYAKHLSFLECIAIALSVTVSIADIGTLSVIFLENFVWILTSRGSTFE